MERRAICLLALAVALDASAVSLLPSKTEVVVADDAPSIVRYAATEATNFLARILGAPVPIVAKAHRDATPVWLGDSPAARKASSSPAGSTDMTIRGVPIFQLPRGEGISSARRLRCRPPVSGATSGMSCSRRTRQGLRPR